MQLSAPWRLNLICPTRTLLTNLSKNRPFGTRSRKLRQFLLCDPLQYFPCA
jgi:hypothetical protein